MFWEVGLLVLSLAAAISTHSGDVPQGESGMDTTGAGALIIKTDPFRYLDSAGVPINDTESLMISEEEIDFHNENSIEERKGCSPTISCTRAGGYCIKGRAKCNGTVDTQGCKGGKRCKCCIPDQITSAHPTCPTTQPICTCPSVTPCPTTTVVPITTDTPTTTVATTTKNIPTTPGPTVNPNLSWLSVGSDRFVRFPQEMNWLAARSMCQANGLDLFEPKDAKAVAIFLDDNFSDRWYWLGGKGNGTHQIWFSGDVLVATDPWYSNYYNNVGTNDCMAIITWNGEPGRGTVLFATSCTGRTSNDVLCG